jgi:hypothetical protein
MPKLAEPTGKYGRWGQAGNALGVIWALGVFSNLVLYRLLDAPFWLLFAFLGLSIVFSIWGAFFFEDDDDSKSRESSSATSSDAVARQTSE